MTVDAPPVTMENLEKIAGYLTVFSQQREFGHWEGGELEDGTLQFPYVVYSKEVDEFLSLLYESHFLVTFDWSSWDDGRELTQDRDRLAQADLLTLRMLMTVIVRNDRFHEGALLNAIKDGLIAAILQRLHQIIPHNSKES